jgi:hypothetical protein
MANTSTDQRCGTDRGDEASIPAGLGVVGCERRVRGGPGAGGRKRAAAAFVVRVGCTFQNGQ